MKLSRTLSDKVVIATLYDRIEKRRKTLGWTQAEIAERIGITAKSYRAIKDGGCRLQTFIALLRQLDLIEQLEVLLPEQSETPMQRLQGQARKGAATSSASERLARLKARRQQYKTK
ncbi:XRE family transcriptional regulator [Pseudidiomarina sediminum]|uniref:XRE family transcriptional regulator n=1 Tax=Pseudidiomarina sediminum TaxID=431675 RepID=A0A432Z3U8_9GAMM|nr:helix-turn-helix transcriptional regulator [Pseudidiomarina sediminum]MBY6062741.1 helix-turn-helix transcriptional regulator [Pseudidiomarina sediminum]RUO72545.1 XRE family transcriptional regulator [Pseudidiomarina sediminum]